MSTDTRSQIKTGSEEDPELLKHIAALGLKTIGDYRAWCGEHGFSRRLHKSWRERGRERDELTRGIAAARLAQKKRLTRNPARLIEAVLNGNVAIDELRDPLLSQVERVRCLASNAGATERLRQLLLHAERHTYWLHTRPVLAQFGQRAGNTYFDALLALARQPFPWLRPLGSWIPQTHNARRQFTSLARHLYARWPVPTFMDSAWFAGDTYDGQCQQAWFLHVGAGENIRTAPTLPLAYTKRMAHHFMESPADLTIEGALRRGQILALGGSERLCRAVTATRLGTEFAQDEFWTSVLRFFIENPMLDLAQVGPIVDYVYAQKLAATEGGLGAQPMAPQPNFTMKGRTPESLLRQVEAWHLALAKLPTYQAEWKPSGIPDFRFVEGTDANSRRVWTITELLSTKALVTEGRTMHHCVASYAQSCARRVSAIFSMELEDRDGRRKVLTAEVHLPTKVICQARGKWNIEPTDKHRNILRRWAEQWRFKLAAHV